MAKQKKLAWTEYKGMIYVGIPKDDKTQACNKCAFEDTENCAAIDCVGLDDYIPLEPQHIPNLRKHGRKPRND